MTLALGAILLAGCSSNKAQESRGEVPGLAEAIAAQKFVINVDMAIPASGRSRMLTSPYSLTIDSGRVNSYMPYFGRAYSVPYGGGEGLIFEGEADDYSLGYGRNGEATISFTVRTKEDSYRFNLDIFPNGSSSVSVNPNNKQPISFTGKATPLE